MFKLFILSIFCLISSIKAYKNIEKSFKSFVVGPPYELNIDDESNDSKKDDDKGGSKDKK
jgi:hypothetical protein